MTSPPPTLQARAASTVPLKRQGEKLLGRLLRRSSSVVLPRGDLDGGDPFLEVGRRLRHARESRGLSLRELALETRISITVLEALEKGWRDRLPEPAYLRTMLALLEQHLALESGSLAAALPPRISRSRRSSLHPHREHGPLTSIALFATWQGALLYALLCLLLIYGLNRQQQRLVQLGLLPLQTVPAHPASPSGSTDAGERDRARLLAAYPDLRPLEQARRGQGLALLRRQQEGKPPQAGLPGQRASVSRQLGTDGRPVVKASGSGGASPAGEAAAQDAAGPAPRP